MAFVKQTLLLSALPFLAASLIFAAQQKWYWTVFMVCFAAYNVGTRLGRLSLWSMATRALLILPWCVLTLMEIMAGRWLGVLAYGGVLVWHIAVKRVKQQRVA